MTALLIVALILPAERYLGIQKEDGQGGMNMRPPTKKLLASGNKCGLLMGDPAMAGSVSYVTKLAESTNG